MPRRAAFLPDSRPFSLLLLLLTTACGGPATAPPPQALAPQPPKPQPIARYRSEQEWIVADIVGAMAGMAEYARTGKPGTADRVSVSMVPAAATDANAKAQPPRFTVQREAGGPPLTIVVQTGIWWPADYAAAASSLFGAAPNTGTGAPAAATGGMDLPFVTALLTPTASVLIEQDARISKILAKDMRSARAHDQAALLLGTLALREAAGVFEDVRSTLSRMTAHLACAAALRGAEPQSAEGFLAETILLTLSGHQEAARADIQSIDLESSPEPLRAWIRALTLRITGDWRMLPQPHQAALLERFEYARAVHDRLGTNHLLAFLDGPDGESPIPDWQHIVLQRGITVEAGNMFTGPPLAKDLREASDVWVVYHGAPRNYQPAGAMVMADLNDAPWPSPVHAADQIGNTGKAQPPLVHVIDWGRWAAFLQRHVCAHLAARAKTHRALGMADENQQFFNGLDELFGKLALYPLVQRAAATDAAGYARAMDGARKLALEHPERLTAEVWYQLLEKPTAYATPPTTFPTEQTWFKDGILPNTPFELGRRVLRPRHTAPPDWIDRWKAMRPFDAWVARAAAYSRVDDHPTLDAVLNALGPLADYDMLAMGAVFDTLPMSSEQAIALGRKLCDADIDSCDRLGTALLRANRDGEAAAVYEKWAASARDTVSVSNGLAWLVRYYADTHRDARARDAAATAAGTGAQAGLETQADLLDRQGRYDEAEALYKHIAERYHDRGMLGAFYQRMARRSHDVKYEISAKNELKETFEHGIEPIALDALASTGPPTDGMTFAGLSPRALACGIRDGDVIVAVDGTRIRNWSQYHVAARFAEISNDRMEFVVWREGRYQTLKLRVPQRWFAADLNDYKPITQQARR